MRPQKLLSPLCTQKMQLKIHQSDPGSMHSHWTYNILDSGVGPIRCKIHSLNPLLLVLDFHRSPVYLPSFHRSEKQTIFSTELDLLGYSASSFAAQSSFQAFGMHIWCTLFGRTSNSISLCSLAFHSPPAFPSLPNY